MSYSVLELPQLAATASRVLIFLATISFMTLTMAWWFIHFIKTHTHTVLEHIREDFRGVYFELTLDTSPAAMAQADRERRAQYPRPRFSKRELLQKAESRQYRNEVREAELAAAIYPNRGWRTDKATMERCLMETLLECDDKKEVVAKRMLGQVLGPDDENEPMERRVLRRLVQREAKREAEELRLLEHLYYDHNEEEFGNSCVREDTMRLI